MIRCICDEMQPYIFVSYSHKDSNEVHEIISEMYEKGYNIWFDEGIDPGTEWDEHIATHIQKAGYFLAFLSQNYVLSSNCKDELNYARDLDKERQIVYLDNVDLPAGMAMRLNRLQSIYKYKYDNCKDFYDKLFSTKQFELFIISTIKIRDTENVSVLKSTVKTKIFPDVRHDPIHFFDENDDELYCNMPEDAISAASQTAESPAELYCNMLEDAIRLATYIAHEKNQGIRKVIYNLQTNNSLFENSLCKHISSKNSSEENPKGYYIHVPKLNIEFAGISQKRAIVELLEQLEKRLTLA